CFYFLYHNIHLPALEVPFLDFLFRYTSLPSLYHYDRRIGAFLSFPFLKTLTLWNCCLFFVQSFPFVLLGILSLFPVRILYSVADVKQYWLGCTQMIFQ